MQLLGQKEIEENSVLLCEMMGLEKKKNGEYNVGFVDKLWRGDEFVKNTEVFHPKFMNWHYEYNWIMRVVEWIESSGYAVFIIKNDVVIKGGLSISAKSIINRTDNKYTVRKCFAIYIACVDFAKWWKVNGEVSSVKG